MAPIGDGEGKPPLCKGRWIAKQDGGIVRKGVAMCGMLDGRRTWFSKASEAESVLDGSYTVIIPHADEKVKGLVSYRAMFLHIRVLKIFAFCCII